MPRANERRRCLRGACMLQKGACMLGATSIRHVLNARSVEYIGVCSARLRAEWVRNGRGGNWIRRSCGAKIRFGARVTGKLASNACAKPATTCKQLHEMSVAASPVGDVDA